MPSRRQHRNVIMLFIKKFSKTEHHILVEEKLLSRVIQFGRMRNLYFEAKPRQSFRVVSITLSREKMDNQGCS